MKSYFDPQKYTLKLKLQISPIYGNQLIIVGPTLYRSYSFVFVLSIKNIKEVHSKVEYWLQKFSVLCPKPANLPKNTKIKDLIEYL